MNGLNAFSHRFTLKFSRLTFTCSKSTKETLEKGVKYVQSELLLHPHSRLGSYTNYCCLFQIFWA